MRFNDHASRYLRLAQSRLSKIRLINTTLVLVLGLSKKELMLSASQLTSTWDCDGCLPYLWQTDRQRLVDSGPIEALTGRVDQYSPVAQS